VKSASRILVLILILLLAGTLHAQEDFDIPVLEDGARITNVFENGMFAHLYAFWGSEDDEVTIRMLRPDDSEIDPYLMLIGADGAVLAVDDDGGEQAFSAFIDMVRLPEDGTYLILATLPEFILMGGSRMDAGLAELNLEYELRLEGINRPGEIEDGLALDTELSSVGETITVDITRETPIALVTFEASGGDQISIATLPADGDEVDTIIYLFDDDGLNISYNDDGDTVPLYSQIADFELPEDGKYLILVTAYQFYDALSEDWENTGTVSLRLE
jgi:hypothetical protein